MAQSIAAIAAVFAAVVAGGFLAALAANFSTRGDMLRRLFACRGCGAIPAPRDLAPLLNWFICRARCRRCGTVVATFDPPVQLAAVAVALWSATVFTGWRLGATCLLGWLLLGLAIVDHCHFRLPNVLTLPLLAAGLAAAAAGGGPSLGDAVIGAVAGFTAFAAVGWLYRRSRGRDGLGLGDAKLLGAVGAWVGWPALPGVVLAASLTALVGALGRAGGTLRANAATPLAFGPYIALATWLAVLYGPLLRQGA